MVGNMHAVNAHAGWRCKLNAWLSLTIATYRHFTEIQRFARLQKPNEPGFLHFVSAVQAGYDVTAMVQTIIAILPSMWWTLFPCFGSRSWFRSRSHRDRLNWNTKRHTPYRFKIIHQLHCVHATIIQQIWGNKECRLFVAPVATVAFTFSH